MAPSSFSRSELKDLDLIKLVDWQGVGLQLGIEDYELQKIKLNYQEHDDRKREMWLRTCTNPNYHDLFNSLEAKEVTSSKVNQQHHLIQPQIEVSGRSLSTYNSQADLSEFELPRPAAVNTGKEWRSQMVVSVDL